ncbi:hypothetical protein B0H13DRAFT_1854645 [Mycena leptocephala]|nr:hypothetical protein B0H13DRAFT_1854645 [Mycena leptocephala]
MTYTEFGSKCRFEKQLFSGFGFSFRCPGRKTSSPALQSRTRRRRQAMATADEVAELYAPHLQPSELLLQVLQQKALIGNCEYCSDETFDGPLGATRWFSSVYLGDTGGLGTFRHASVSITVEASLLAPKALTPDFLPYPTADEVAAANQFGETFALWSIGSYRACAWYGGDVSLGYFGEMNLLREVLRRHARPANIFNYKEPEYEIYAFEWS